MSRIGVQLGYEGQEEVYLGQEEVYLGREEVYLRDEAVHLLVMLCIWRSPMITSSVSRYQTWNRLVVRGANAKMSGHGVQF